LKIIEWVQPRNRPPCGSCIAGTIQCAPYPAASFWCSCPFLPRRRRPRVSGESLIGTAPNLIYTPNSNFYGSDSFTFKVNDGTEDSALATVSITVSPINDPPMANGDTAETQEDTPIVRIDVLANDTDVDDDSLKIISITQGKNGSVTINPDSTLAYSPHAKFYGSDVFTHRPISSGPPKNITRIITTKPKSSPIAMYTEMKRSALVLPTMTYSSWLR